MKHSLKRRKGMTLVELLVGLTVMSIAAVGTATGFWSAYGQLERQRHKMRANQLLRQYTEKYQGLIHTYPPTEIIANQYSRWEQVIIDPRGPGSRDDIIGEIRRWPIGKEHVEGSNRLVDYNEIVVEIVYPSNPRDHALYDDQVYLKLVSYWLYGISG
jgi:prepilin-type N-terminal cleavage/methylation domain-containing protein